MTYSTKVRDMAAAINHTLYARKLMIVTVESCTGGLISGALTDVPGSSDAVFGGFVTYANAAKTGFVGVPAELIEQHGAVSEPVARAMAEGGRMAAGVGIAVSATGVAGPGGGTENKPVGLVHFACATAERTVHRKEMYGDLGRQGIRDAAVETALQLVKDVLDLA